MNNVPAYTCYSRFIIKQTHGSLRPSPVFVHRYPKHHVSQSYSLRDLNDFHGKGSISNGFEWYELTFVASYTAQNGLTVLCFDIPVHIKMALKKSFQEDGACADIQDPYAMLVRIMEQVITLYDDSVWTIRNHVCLSEAVSWPY